MKNLVEPIKNREQVKAVEMLLAQKSLRNQLIWVFGCNKACKELGIENNACKETNH